jgi:hypothetical protein
MPIPIDLNIEYLAALALSVDISKNVHSILHGPNKKFDTQKILFLTRLLKPKHPRPHVKYPKLS